MKRSRLSYDEWKCIISKDIRGRRIRTDFFEGYLDLVVYPDGTIIVDDMDELEDALSQKDITQEQFDLAISTCRELENGMPSHIAHFIDFTRMCYKMIE